MVANEEASVRKWWDSRVFPMILYNENKDL